MAEVGPVDHVLRQWALYSHFDADDGPEIQRVCGSAEGNYSVLAWDSEDAPAPLLPDPDADMAEAMESAWRAMPVRLHKLVLRTHYVDLFFVPLRYTEDKLIAIGARRMKMLPLDYQHALFEAREALREYLQRRGII